MAAGSGPVMEFFGKHSRDATVLIDLL